MELQIIQHKIFEIRDYRVMLDFHLAELYRVETRVLNQSVKRNIKRFPSDFMFQLTKEEWKNMSSQIVMTYTTKRPKTALPFAFTEQGVAMLSSVLRSETAIAMNVGIMRAFVLMRQMAMGYDELLKRIEELEESTDVQFSEVYQALTQLLSKPEPPPRRPIGYRITNEMNIETG